jgi:hypothetical protein
VEQGWKPEDDAFVAVWVTWLVTHNLGRLIDTEQDEAISRSWFEAWLLGKLLRRALNAMDVKEPEAEQSIRAVKALLGIRGWGPLDTWRKQAPIVVLRKALRDQDVQTFLRVNRYQGVLWFHKESFESLLWWRLALATIALTTSESEKNPAEVLVGLYTTITTLVEAADQSGYQVDKLIETVDATATATTSLRNDDV